jgi:acetyl-CoA carboxylase carboxyltransferase component
MEIDAVIDPAETRQWLTRGVRSAGPRTRRAQPIVDVW